MEPREFPLGDSLAGGAWQITEHLCGRGSQELYAAERPGGGERAAVAVIWAPRGVPHDELVGALAPSVAGVLPLDHLGSFDPAGDDPMRRVHQAQHQAIVEPVPQGAAWLPWLLRGEPLGADGALALAAAAGAILLRAAADGVLPVGVRPETIWARRDGDRLAALGLSGRTYDFFAHTGGGCIVPGRAFERHYLAPEVYLERGQSEASLAFSLAAMTAEWATGAYPFPDAWAGGSARSLVLGQHAALDVPAEVAALLSSALRADPAARTSLRDLVDGARRLIER